MTTLTQVQESGPARRRWRITAPVALALALAGCSDSGRPLLAPQPSEPKPVAVSPVMAVRLLEWAWDHRDHQACEEVLTDDFLFVCAEPDSAGNAFVGRVITRFDETQFVRRLFVGGGSHPPANHVSLQLDANLIPVQDSRPGKGDMALHREVTTSVVLRIDTDEDDFRITGSARFFLVRGDAAVLPPGFRPDPARWFIQRWEDETVGPGGSALRARGRDPGPLRAMPSRNMTWCELRAIYR